MVGKTLSSKCVYWGSLVIKLGMLTKQYVDAGAIRDGMLSESKFNSYYPCHSSPFIQLDIKFLLFSKQAIKVPFKCTWRRGVDTNYIVI